jgi:hypothetical protein
VPFVINPDDQDQQNKQNQQDAISGPQTITSGQSGVISGSDSGSGNPSAGKPSSSGSYTNLQDYLNANKDQAAQLGSTVASNISKDGTTASNSINDASNQFQNQVGQGTIKNLGTAEQDTAKAISNAQNLTAGQKLGSDDLDNFKAVSNATYTGPKTFQDAGTYQPAYDATQKAINEGEQTKTDSGRYAILQNMFARPTYSSGETSLDNLLLNVNPDSQAQLNQARQNVSGLNNQFQTAQDTGAAYATDIANKTAAAKQNAISAFNTGRTTTQGAVDTRLNDVQSHWNDQYNNLLGALQGYKGGDLSLTSDQAKQLGVFDGGRIYNELSGTDPASYLHQQAFDANKEVNGDEQNRLAALDQLAGLGGLSQTNKYTNAALAGTQTLQDAVDASDFGKSQQQRQNDFTNYANTTNEVGAGHGERENNDWSGYHGTATADQRYTQTLADAAAGGGNISDNLGASHNYGTNLAGAAGAIFTGGVSLLPSLIGSSGSDAQGRATDDANKFAYANLQAAIQDDLKRQGYANQIKIAGANPTVNPLYSK